MLDVVEIQLTQGKVALVDSDDAPELERYLWYAVFVEKQWWYATRNRNEIRPRRQIRMHRQILKVEDDVDIDHVNGNGLDNRRSNLRIATANQNGYNRKLNYNNTSGYTGVVWDRKLNKWAARLKWNGRQVHLGFFSSPEEAAITRDEAARLHHGAFGRYNFPRPGERGVRDAV